MMTKKIMNVTSGFGRPWGMVDHVGDIPKHANMCGYLMVADQ